MTPRRGQAALFAVAVLSLAVLAYVYALASARVSIVYHGEAEWMLLLATARHSLASNTSLDVLMERLRLEASQGAWLPPVEWASSYTSNATGWAYTARFYNESLPGFEARFYASASYALLGAEYDSYGNRWLVYNVSYLHVYKLPEYGYPIVIRPAPLNSSCARAYGAGQWWLVKVKPPCTARDKWGIPVIAAPGG